MGWYAHRPHSLLQGVMRKGLGLASLPLDQTLGAAAVTAVYFLAGWVVFHRLYLPARKLARLGHY